jgi:2-polyprenyl-6-hydroxyphenyl methylase / 3-demethylubiquinone-9 3-methyltransferase
MTRNTDPEEIAKFDRIAKQWWDLKGPMKPLHQLNPLRLSLIQEQINLTNKRVLDIGCGGGILSEAMAREGAQVTGIDMSTAALNAAITHAKEHHINIEYQTTTAEDHADNHSAHYDVITCLEMLEHVPDPSSIVATCKKMLKPDGKLFFSTINRTAKAYLFAIIGAEHLLKLLPKGTHEHHKFIQPAELNNWCEQQNLKLETLTGIHYNPLTQHFKLTKDVSVNYLCCYTNDN